MIVPMIDYLRATPSKSPLINAEYKWKRAIRTSSYPDQPQI